MDSAPRVAMADSAHSCLHPTSIITCFGHFVNRFEQNFNKVYKDVNKLLNVNNL